jgi:hypothetical protein
VKRRLAIIRHAEEVTGNVALICRYYGISRQCYHHGMCPRLQYLRSTSDHRFGWALPVQTIEQVPVPLVDALVAIVRVRSVQGPGRAGPLRAPESSRPLRLCE